MAIFDVRDFGATGNDATDDTKAIQAALDAAHAAGGGHVYIPEGTYILTGTGDASDGALRVYSNTELYGDGMGETILKLADGYSKKITGLIRTPVNEVTTDVVIRDLTLDGNRAKASAEVDGIMTGVLPGSSQQDARILIERVEIHDVSRIAFNPHEQTTDLTIRDCVAHHNSWDGFVGDFVSNATYEGNVAYSNDRHGFNIVTHSHDVVVTNNVSYDNAEVGIIVQRGSGSKSIDGWENMLNYNVLVENNEVYGNGTHGIVLKQVESSQVLDNDIHDNGGDGIHLEGAHDNVISGNLISGQTQAIEIAKYPGSLGGPSASYDNLVTANVIDRTSEALVESGSSTKDNIFTDNVILEGLVKVGAASIVDDNIVLSPFDEIAIVTDMPIIDGVPYGGLVMNGTIGDDLIVGSAAGDEIYGNGGNDTLHGAGGDDLIKGRSGDDTILGGDGDDRIWGGKDNDRIEGGAGNDSLYGDDLNSDQGNDVMYGGDGNDLLKGRGGNDMLFGDAGDDTISGGEGSDTIHGGAGDDLLYGDDTDGASGNDVMYGDDGNDILKGRGGDDKLSGDSGDDKLWGESGNDTLNGGDGNDALYGGTGNDTLLGGAGDDKLSGEEGKDVLNGGLGEDALYGGAGADTFVLDATAFSALDTVKDFNLSEGDVLLLDHILSGFDPLSSDIAEFVTLTQSGTKMILSVDSDGAGVENTAQAVAVLKGVVGLDLNDLYDTGHLAVA